MVYFIYLILFFSCLKIVQGMMELKSDELHNAVKKLRAEELVVLLDFAAQWNTNSRTADVSIFCITATQFFFISLVFLLIFRCSTTNLIGSAGKIVLSTNGIKMTSVLCYLVKRYLNDVLYII